MNWGARIVVAFIVFGIIMGILITISFNQEINLVAEDYYKQEIEYDSQIEKQKNTASLQSRPILDYDAQQKVLSLSFPSELSMEFKEGEIHFFRPSDYKMDKKVRIGLDDQGKQYFDLNSLETGLWEAKMTWQSGDKEYYLKKKIII